MEKNNHLKEFDADSVSLCDLSSLPEDQELKPKATTSLDHQEFFEFSTPLSSKLNPKLDNNNIIFCGKLILHKTQEEEEEEPTINIIPLNKNSPLYPFDLQSPKPFPPRSPLPVTGSLRYQGSSSRKHKVLIGLAKIPQKMELSDIKKRQSRRAPASMFPALADGEGKVAVDGGDGGGVKDQTGVARLLKCKAYFARALGRACFRCIPIM